MWIQDILFLFPSAALALWFIPLLVVLFLLLFKHRQRVLKEYAHHTILTQLLVARSPQMYWVKAGGWIIIWILLTITMMNPQLHPHYEVEAGEDEMTAKIRYRPHEVILMIDVSASMGVQDTPLNQSRLERSISIADTVLQQLMGPTVSLYAFTDKLIPISPPTVDYLYVRMKLKELRIQEGGTSFYEPLAKLREDLLPNPKKLYTLILFSDGEDNQLETLQGDAYLKLEEKILATLQPSQNLNLQVFTVGVGSTSPQEIPHVTFQGQPVRSALRPQLLQNMATHGHGFYFNGDEPAWNLGKEIADKITQNPNAVITPTEAKLEVLATSKVVGEPLFQYPLGLALVLFGLIYLLPDVRRKGAPQ